jgi:hypothetical protein
MDQSDALFTIAEISVALAGFAGLVSVLGRGRNRESAIADSLRLQNMLEMALLNAAFALLPLPLLVPTAPGPEVWGVASAAHLIAGLGLTTAGVYRFRATRPEPDPLWISVAMVLLTAIGFSLDAFNALGLAGARSFSVYLGTLIIALVSAGLKFMAVAASVFRAPEDRSAV